MIFIEGEADDFLSKKRIKKILGEPYTIQQAVSSGGIGSPVMTLEGGEGEIASVAREVNPRKLQIERFPKGLLLRMMRLNVIGAFVIPYEDIASAYLQKEKDTLNTKELGYYIFKAMLKRGKPYGKASNWLYLSNNLTITLWQNFKRAEGCFTFTFIDGQTLTLRCKAPYRLNTFLAPLLKEDRYTFDDQIPDFI